MLLEQVEVKRLQRITDSRGSLVEILRGDSDPLTAGGQIYLTTAAPGCTKGSHYHRRKTEWFFVVLGCCLLQLADVTRGQTEELVLCEEVPIAVKIPPLIAHAVRNTGRTPLYLLAYIDAAYDPARPDTFPYSAWR